MRAGVFRQSRSQQNGMTTISPATGLTMRHPLPESSNRAREQTRSVRAVEPSILIRIVRGDFFLVGFIRVHETIISFTTKDTNHTEKSLFRAALASSAISVVKDGQWEFCEQPATSRLRIRCRGGSPKWMLQQNSDELPATLSRGSSFYSR